MQKTHRQVMKINLILILVLIFNISCSEEFNQSDFEYENIESFIFNKSLLDNYNQLKKSNSKIFKKIGKENVYLYSWENQNPNNNEFTVITKDGLTNIYIMYYIILDKNEKTISYYEVANYGSEGIYLFETWTKRKNRDTLITISSKTEWWDLENEKEMKIPKGDSIFSYLIIDKNSVFKKYKFKEIRNLE